MSNPKKQVLDVQNCRLFSGLNVCYKWMLRNGQLEKMRQDGKLDPIPEEDTHGWYKMRRYFPPGIFVQEDEEGFAQAIARCGYPKQLI